jgi:hypothetical protein
MLRSKITKILNVHKRQRRELPNCSQWLMCLLGMPSILGSIKHEAVYILVRIQEAIVISNLGLECKIDCQNTESV